jgi:hypothetical protein
MHVKAKGTLRTDQILERLRAKFAPPAYGLLTEVSNATGFGAGRWCDALVMGLWPSRGLELIGIEIKSSRSDWVKERDDPAKADAIGRFCDRWYLAVGDPKIVKPGELPQAWGLMVPSGSGMKIAIEPPKIEAVPITRSFLAAIFRRSVEQSATEADLKKRYDAGFSEGKKCAELPLKYELESLRKLREKVTQFETFSGLNIHYGYEDAKDIGNAVTMVLRGDHKHHENDLIRLKDQAERIAKAISRELKPVATDEDD